MEDDEWKIAWNEAFSVGNSEMDAEHQQFIKRVNELNKTILDAENKELVEYLMNMMILEATRHFRHEEQLLNASKYPKAKAHAERHQQLISEFDRALEEFREADLSYVWAVKGLRIKQLLVEHLMHDDMEYKGYFRARRASHDSARQR